jgi:CRISPR-associated protein Cas5d
MRPEDYAIRLKVWGDWACFTRPELKVERVSYQLMTPSAARAILEAIFWKRHLFRWVVHSISVLKPIQYSAIRRNEVEKVMGRNLTPIIADDCRTQRNTLALRDVAYVIQATVHLLDGQQKHPNHPQHKNRLHEYKHRFDQNAHRGKCWYRPCLGCREFAANFAPAVDDETPIDRTEPLGLMLYDYFDVKDPAMNQTPIPRWFPAKLEKGVMKIDRSEVIGPVKEI